jgi:hypothetical protein
MFNIFSNIQFCAEIIFYILFYLNNEKLFTEIEQIL